MFGFGDAVDGCGDLDEGAVLGALVGAGAGGDDGDLAFGSDVVD